MRLVPVLFACALAACAGGGGSPVAGPRPVFSVTPQRETSVSLTVTFPAKSTATSNGRRREYISPSIESLSLVIDGAAPIYINAPAPTNSPQTITTIVPAQPGNDLFAIAEYDKASGAGNLLGDVMQMDTVVAGTLNTLNITVNGELAKIAIQAEPSAFVEGTVVAGVTLVGNQPQTFLAVPEDADGNTIVSPGLVPSIAETSATPAAIVATQGAGDQFTLAAPAPTTNVEITATGNDLEGKPVTATFEADALAAFYIADYTIQQIRVFDENGTPLALPSTAFPGVTNPMGLAYVPGTPGSVVVTQTSNFQAPYITSFDPAGNAQTLPAGAFSGVSQPLFLAYGANELFVPNYYNSTLSIFSPTGTSVAEAAGSFAKLQQPAGAAYDTNNGELYVTNTGADTVSAYSPATGALIATASTGSHPMGVVFDANDKSIYVAYGGTDGDALDAPNTVSPQNAGISEFSEALAAISTTGGFTNASTSTFFTGIAFDPYTKQLYVSDSGMSAIDAFTETGAAVTLPAGAFSTISSTTSPPGDPMAILLIP